MSVSLRISIHAPREGGDVAGFVQGCKRSTISIHAPREGGDAACPAVPDLGEISIHAPREGGDRGLLNSITIDSISIHAPREGGDSSACVIHPTHSHFNPRPPRGGRRQTSPADLSPQVYFNPRPPRGGRLLGRILCKLLTVFQSTPPARGATPSKTARISAFFIISIHAPREGGDDTYTITLADTTTFQSTPPARGATAKMHSFTCGSLTNK